MSKLTLDDLYKQYGELMSHDPKAELDRLKLAQAIEQKEMADKHHLARTNLRNKASKLERQQIELKAAIQLAKAGMDPMQAVIQAKGCAMEVQIGHGPETLWIMPPSDDDGA